jgi:hypothetical protein
MNHDPRPDPEDENWRYAVVPAAIWGVLLVLASLGGLVSGDGESAPMALQMRAGGTACMYGLWSAPGPDAPSGLRRASVHCNPVVARHAHE